MSKAMYQKLINFILIIFLITSCSKKIKESNIPADKEMSFVIYKEAVVAMNEGE